MTFHPFAKYPGPILAKVTSLYGAYYAYTGEIHLNIEQCHKKYGRMSTQVVRFNSYLYRQIRSILSQFALGQYSWRIPRYYEYPSRFAYSIKLTGADIYGNLKKVKKSKSYIIHGKTNLIVICDKTEYTRSKKIFQQGFSDTANREHKPRVIQEIDTFLEKISENETPEDSPDGWTNPKNMSLWCMFSLCYPSNRIISLTILRQLPYDRCC